MKKAEINKIKKAATKAAATLEKNGWESAELRDLQMNLSIMYGDWIDEDPSRENNDEAAMFMAQLCDWADGYTEDTQEANREAARIALDLIWHFENN